jgi:AI-2 transport protein TqsA
VSNPPPSVYSHPAFANANTLRVAAYTTIIIVGSWFMLGQLKVVLRPLLLAVFLGYVLMPYYGRLRKKLPAMVALALLAGGAILGFAILAMAVTGNLIALTSEAPNLKLKTIRLIRETTEWVQKLPFVPPPAISEKPVEAALAERITDESLVLLNVVAVSIPEVLATGLYLMFLLLESARFPQRVRKAYPTDRAEQILDVFGRINSAIISYLKAKFLSSIIVAVPVGIALAVGGVRFAILWAVLTFVGNFIPYVGSAVAYTLPVAFAFTQSDGILMPVVIAVVVALIHVVSATVAEPMILGRAVGLSPLVILAALTLWGLLWGLPGMFLAVPLTVVVKIVLENIELTRPVGKLLGGE